MAKFRRTKLHKYSQGAKEMQLELSQQLLNYDDVRGDFN